MMEFNREMFFKTIEGGLKNVSKRLTDDYATTENLRVYAIGSRLVFAVFTEEGSQTGYKKAVALCQDWYQLSGWKFSERFKNAKKDLRIAMASAWGECRDKIEMRDFARQEIFELNSKDGQWESVGIWLCGKQVTEETLTHLRKVFGSNVSLKVVGGVLSVIGICSGIPCLRAAGIALPLWPDLEEYLQEIGRLK